MGASLLATPVDQLPRYRPHCLTSSPGTFQEISVSKEGHVFLVSHSIFFFSCLSSVLERNFRYFQSSHVMVLGVFATSISSIMIFVILSINPRARILLPLPPLFSHCIPPSVEIS